MEDNNSVRVCEKIALTVKEASEYSNIGITKIYKLLSDPMCPFVLHVGNKKLIKRKAFEKYVETQLEI